MTKKERIIRYFCNYLIDNQIPLEDKEEEDCGQCISTIKLSDVLKGTNIDYTKLTLDEMSVLLLANYEVFRNNDEETDDYYGEIIFTNLYVADGDLHIEIWDGY